MEALPRSKLADVVDPLALIECVEKARKRPEIERDGADVQQVVVNPHQLGKNRADVAAPRGDLDSEQLLDGVEPGNLVRDRRDVVHPIDDRHVLVVREVLAQLLEAAVQIADVGNGFHDPFTVQREHQPQRRVRCGVLRTEVQGPEILLFGSIRFGKV